MITHIAAKCKHFLRKFLRFHSQFHLGTGGEEIQHPAAHRLLQHPAQRQAVGLQLSPVALRPVRFLAGLQPVCLEVRHHQALRRAEACIRHALEHHLHPLHPGIIHRCRHQQGKPELPPHLFGPAHLPAEVGCQEFRDL